MKITKTQLKEIIKEELDSTLKEAASPDSPGLLRAIWNMLKDEFEEDDIGRFARQDDAEMEARAGADMEVPEKTPEEEEEEERRARAKSLGVGPKATSHRDAYYRGGTFDPTLEEVIKKEVRKLLKTKK